MIAKVREWLLLIGMLTCLVCCVVILNRTQEAQILSYSAPVMSEKTSQPVIDKEELREIIQFELSQIPKPKDGSNGENGADGSNGQNGKDAVTPVIDYSHIQSLITGEIAKIPTPTGETILPEFQTNKVTGDFEWRLPGDDSWTIYLLRCEILRACASNE